MLNLKNNGRACARGKHGGAEPWDERQGGNSGVTRRPRRVTPAPTRTRAPVSDAPVFQGGSQNQAGQERDKTHDTVYPDTGQRTQMAAHHVKPCQVSGTASRQVASCACSKHTPHGRGPDGPTHGLTLGRQLSERHWGSPQAQNNFHITECVLPLTASPQMHWLFHSDEPARLFNLVVMILLHTAQKKYI